MADMGSRTAIITLCLLLLAALGQASNDQTPSGAVTSAAVDIAADDAMSVSLGRKLLQPFTLFLGRAYRKATVTAREANAVNLANTLVPSLVPGEAVWV